MKDLGDKIDASEKAPVEDALAKLKAAISSNDIEAMKKETESVHQAFYKISEKLYSQANPGAQGAPGQGAGPDAGAAGGYTDAGFKDAGGDF